MKILRVTFVIAVLCAPFYAQQVNQDVVPASPGLYLGHTNQRWNGYFNNADIYNLTINGSPIGTAGIGLPQISIPNGTNCTTLNGLVEFDGNGQAQTASLSSTKVIGVAVSGAGCSGNVLVQYAAIVNCTTDGSTLINDRIAASNSIAGDCMDIGPVSIPGIQTVGLVTVVSSGAGQLTSFDLFTGDTISPSSSSGSGVVSVSPCIGPFGYAATAGAIVSWDCNTSLDGSGNAGFKKVTVTGSGAGKIDFGTSTTPGNPAGGFDRIYGNSISGMVTCLTSAGANCLLPWIDFCSQGGVCDGSTDDSAAFNTALGNLKTAGGGTLWINPTKTAKLTSQITVPANTAGPLHQQQYIRITSSNGPYKSWGSNVIANGGTLDMTFNAANGKLITQGLGPLEIDHINIKDSAADCAAFIYDTLSTVHIHDVSFRGTAAATAACNDAIILGGTDNNTNNTITSAFNGYGSIIENNFFAQIRSGVKLGSFANGIQIVHNTWNTDCGGSTNAAIESTGVVSNTNTGNYIAGNLIELTNYQYGIWLHAYSNSFVMVGNNLFDTGTSTAGYRFETNDQYSLVMDTTNAGPVKFSDATGTNTFITSEQSIASIIPQPWTFTNTVKESGAASLTAYDIFNTTDNSEGWQQMINGANPDWQFWMKPLGGTAVALFDVADNGGNAFLTLLGAARIKNVQYIEPGTGGQGLVLCNSCSGSTVYLNTTSGPYSLTSGGTRGTIVNSFWQTQGPKGDNQTASYSSCESSDGNTTLNTGATTTDTGLNCLPANAIIDAVVYRITTTITTAANFTIGDATIAARFCTTQSTLTSGTTGICFLQADQTGTSGPRQTAAAKVRITTNVNPGAGAIELRAYYHTWAVPSS